MLILLIVLGIMAGISLMVANMKSPTTPKATIGGPFIKDFPINDVASIVIQSKEDTVSLGKKDDKWVVKSRFDFPADFKKIIDFVKKWRDAKTGRTFNGSDATIARLGMVLPTDETNKSDSPPENESDTTTPNDDELGIRITLANEDNNAIADVVIGKTRETETGMSGGQYIKKFDDSLVYLIDQSFKYTEKKSSAWLDKDIINIEEKNVQRIECINEKGQKVYAISREDKDKKAELEDPPKDQKLKQYEIDNVVRALSTLRLEDIASPDQKLSNLDQLPHLKYYLFDGTIYTMYPEKAFVDDKDQYFMRIRVSYQEPPKKEEPETAATPEPVSDTAAAPVPEAKEDETPKKTPEELAFDAENQNKKMSDWTYILSKWKFENFIMEMKEFFEEEKKDS